MKVKVQREGKISAVLFHVSFFSPPHMTRHRLHLTKEASFCGDAVSHATKP